MTLHTLKSTVLLASVFLYGAVAYGSTIYNESVSGDLSNNGLAPTVLTISTGLNDVIGTTGRTGSIIDRDYFTFTVSPGQQLTSLTVLPGTAPLGALAESFIGIQAGPQVTVSTAATDATGLLGWDHYIGTNILTQIGTSGLGSTGFTGPLPSGTYSFWVQDFNVGTIPYGFEFAVTPSAVTPEPSTLTLMLSGLALLAGETKRRVTRSRFASRSKLHTDLPAEVSHRTCRNCDGPITAITQ